MEMHVPEGDDGGYFIFGDELWLVGVYVMIYQHICTRLMLVDG